MNEPRPAQVLEPGEASVLTSIMEDVVRHGTGRRAAISGRSIAGKTGTTDNYADAWFVGYTPELVVAVWVGYPDRLRPMLTEFDGEPVAGGTFPAQIWKTFMQEALKDKEPLDFPTPSLPYASSRLVVFRDGRLQVDNGNCQSPKSVYFFSGDEPRTANCRENEVEVPRLVGMPVKQARQRLISQPLTPDFIFRPAEPNQRVDVVIAMGEESQIERSIEVAERLVCLQRVIGTGKRSGLRSEIRYACVYTFGDDERIVEVNEYATLDEALEAASRRPPRSSSARVAR